MKVLRIVWIRRGRGELPRLFGGEERSDLEPESFDHLLENLEDWSEVLRGDEELCRVLETFREASLDDPDNPDISGVAWADQLVPDQWEPSP